MVFNHSHSLMRLPQSFILWSAGEFTDGSGIRLTRKKNMNADLSKRLFFFLAADERETGTKPKIRGRRKKKDMWQSARWAIYEMCSGHSVLGRKWKTSEYGMFGLSLEMANQGGDTARSETRKYIERRLKQERQRKPEDSTRESERLITFGLASRSRWWVIEAGVLVFRGGGGWVETVQAVTDRPGTRPCWKARRNAHPAHIWPLYRSNSHSPDPCGSVWRRYQTWGTWRQKGKHTNAPLARADSTACVESEGQELVCFIKMVIFKITWAWITGRSTTVNIISFISLSCFVAFLPRGKFSLSIKRLMKAVVDSV